MYPRRRRSSDAEMFFHDCNPLQLAPRLQRAEVFVSELLFGFECRALRFEGFAVTSGFLSDYMGYGLWLIWDGFMDLLPASSGGVVRMLAFYWVAVKEPELNSSKYMGETILITIKTPMIPT